MEPRTTLVRRKSIVNRLMDKLPLFAYTLYTNPRESAAFLTLSSLQNFRYTLNLLMWEPKNPNWSSRSSKCAPKKYMRFLLRPITSFNTNHLYSSVTAKRLSFRLYHASNNGLESKHSYPQSPLQIKEIHLHLLPCPKCPLTESNTTKPC